MTKARSDLRVKVSFNIGQLSAPSDLSHSQVGLAALDTQEKLASTGSLVGQNGIKYSSEPELVVGEQAGEGEGQGYINLQTRGG